MINTSTGLGYLLSASNESLVADVQGYEVSNPAISIQYQQPLAATGVLPDATALGFSGSDGNIIILLVAALLVTALALAIVILRRRSESARSTSPIVDMKIGAAGSEIAQNPAKTPVMTETKNSSTDSKEDISPPNQFAASPSPEDDGVYLTEASEASRLEDLPRETETSPPPSPPQSLEDQIQNGSEQSGSEPDRISPPDVSAAREEAARFDESLSRVENAKKVDIVISSEMEAVMQTLTAREQAIMKTLIDHGGRMTQADIRYDTRTPKSSLTGILISLERRKLITKKEWGRTNIIELSSWFLSKKERS
jgi:uncharacterized membrane protein